MNKTRKLDELVSSVEALLAKLPSDLSPEIAQLRDRVDQSILDSWTSVARERAQARADVTFAADSLNRYARTNPWLIAGACAVAAIWAFPRIRRLFAVHPHRASCRPA